MDQNLLLNISSSERVAEDIYPTRVYTLLKQQGINPDQLEYIHVAGSKGKGSIARNMFQFLKHKGEPVGLFVSPHILKINERFETNEGLISDLELQEIFNTYKNFLEAQKLHFFEIVLFLSIVYFIKKACKYVILEVGVGGRFDPTNFCKPKVSLLGEISLEHREFLGGSLESIAYNKAGIIKKNIPAFTVPQLKIVREIFQKEGKVFFLEPKSILNQKIHNDGTVSFEFFYHQKNYSIHLNRVGYAHVLNFCLALMGILEIFPNFPSDLINQVAQIKIPYRMDMVFDNILIDTAHNGSSFLNLFQGLDRYLHWSGIILFVTILEGKEIEDVSQQILKYSFLFQKIIVFDFETNRKSDGKTLYHALKTKINSQYIADITTYTLDKNEKYVFAGSFYSIKMINELIAKSNLENK